MNSYPVHVQAHRDDHLSRWLWMVKWIMLVPHYLILIVLWIAFVVTTMVAYVAVLFTGRYPPAIFAFNTGVLRWSWRVNYYGYQALGTDRYPPFTLADVADYPARLHIEPPARLPRWLPLVAWLLAVPHILLVAALTGSAGWQFRDDASAAPIGAVSLGLLIAGISLLFTGRYPRGLYDLLLGIARWSLRVIAYVALLTDRYPPFRLDQGDDEPSSGPVGPASSTTARPADPGGVVPATDTGPQGSLAAPVTALLAGVMLLMLAAGVGLGATTLIGLSKDRDSNGYLTSPTLHVDSSTSAVTVDGVNLHAGDLWARHLSSIGGVQISATSTTGTPLFVGIAPQPAVNEWLAGTAHDRLVTLTTNPGSRYERSSGTTKALPAPGGQTFWLATASGAGRTVLNWQATNGDFAVVLANNDGTPAVSAAVDVASQVPNLTPLGVGLLGGTGALLLQGFLLVYLGANRIGRRHHHMPGDKPLAAPAKPAAELVRAT